MLKKVRNVFYPELCFVIEAYNHRKICEIVEKEQ